MERNDLYPIFLKVSHLNILIVGGGNVALEKLSFLLKSSPNAQVQMVSPMFREETIALAEKFKIEMTIDTYNSDYLQNKHIAIATTDNVPVNELVYHDCRARNILVNVADNPPYCDFYMGGIVTKGNVKVLGGMEYRVKRVPDPVAKVGGITSGPMNASQLRAQRGVFAVLENFDFDLKFNVKSYTVTIIRARQDPLRISVSGAGITSEVTSAMNALGPKDKVLFDDIIASGIPVIQGGEQPVAPTKDNVFQILPGNIPLEKDLGEYYEKVNFSNIDFICECGFCRKF